MNRENLDIAKEAVSRLFKIKLRNFLQDNLKYHDQIELGIMPAFYERYKLFGILKIKAKELTKIRYKHPEAWKNIDNFMKNIDNPLAIMISQNKKDPYTVIILTDIITKDIRRQDSFISYFLRPVSNNSILVSSYKFTEHEINKHIDGLKAIDKEKVERLLGVGVTNKALAISILSKLSTVDSIADLKQIVK